MLLADGNGGDRLAFPYAVIASPTDRAALSRPGHIWTTGHRHVLARSRTSDCSDPTRSPQIIPMALAPPASRNHPLTPPPAKPFLLRHFVPTGGVIGFRSARYVTTPGGLLAVHCPFRSTALPPPPSDPRSPGRPGHQLLELQRPTLGKELHLLVIGTAGRTRDECPLRRGGTHPLHCHQLTPERDLTSS